MGAVALREKGGTLCCCTGTVARNWRHEWDAALMRGFYIERCPEWTTEREGLVGVARG